MQPGTASQPFSARHCSASGLAASLMPHTAAPASGDGPECGYLASPSLTAHTGRVLNDCSV